MTYRTCRDCGAPHSMPGRCCPACRELRDRHNLALTAMTRIPANDELTRWVLLDYVISGDELIDEQRHRHAATA